MAGVNRALVSYWGWRKKDLRGMVESTGGPDRWDIFADSGAFSAYTTGATISIPEYGAWLVAHADVLNFAAGLDVIGDAYGTRKNLDRLREVVEDRVVIVPAFHVGSDWNHLIELCRSCDFVAFGGAATVSGREDALMTWLAKALRITREHGTVVHGFALTRSVYVETLPFYSVDSTYWRGAMLGRPFDLFDRDAHRMIRCQSGRGFLSAAERRVLRQYGQDPAEFGAVGFAHITPAPDRVWARGQRARAGILSMASSIRYERDLQLRGRVCPAPQGVRGDGLKIYPSVDAEELPRVVAAVRVADGVGIMEAVAA